MGDGDGAQAASGRGERGEERIDVGALLAKEAIREALYRELDAWRRRDWTQLRAGFVPGARVELGFEGAHAVDAQVGRLAESMRGYVASSLLASNCQVELGLGGVAARSSALVLATHEPPAESGERTRLEALRFSDRWTRDVDGEWRVSARRTESLWRAWLEPRRDDRTGDHRNAAEWER